MPPAVPSPIVIVLDEPGFGDEVAAALNVGGHEALAVPDSMAALGQLESASRIELLATAVEHPPGKPNGVALALMARTKRPGIKVLFIGPPQLAGYTAGIGGFMAAPVSVSQIVDGITQLLKAEQRT